MPSTTPAQLLAAAAIRWLSLSALAALIGALALDVLILRAGAPELAAARRRVRKWTTLSAAVLLAATAGELIVRARTMSGGGLGVAVSAVPLVLARTHFGLVWTARLATLGVVLGLSFGSSRALRTMAFTLALGLALTTALTGHAADWGDLTPSAFVDWMHILAASAWTGGLIGLTLVVFIERPSWPAALLASVMRRFSTLAGLCLLAVAVSGTYNAWTQLGAPSELWTTTYGRVLAIKLLMVLALVGLGAVNRYAIIPRLDPGCPSPRRGLLRPRLERLAARGVCTATVSPSRLSANLAREALLAILVFACTAVLGEFMPARQERAPTHHAHDQGTGHEER